MSDHEPITLESARDRLRQATRIILDLERAYERAVQDAADAEAVYRSEVAKSFQGFRGAGDAVEAARINAHGTTATFKRETIAAAGMLKLAAEKLEDARDSRRSLWRLMEWAGAREARAAVMQGRLPENSPTANWP